ncbi:MAG TPA: M48 family metalloprotease [Deferrisomatales bacterium]|nr:M48 family metalloprotease [Deferrisomatales bacterium]
MTDMRTFLVILLLLPATASAGWLDNLGKGVLKDLGGGQQQQQPADPAKRTPSKTELLISGVTDVLAGAAEVPYDTERVIGESLALEGFARYGLPVDDPELQRYVNLVGNAVARNSLRPTIPYHFVVVDSPLYNAFACPGGIIFVSSELVRSMHDESELAAVLAHEVGHVAHKHALGSIRRAQFLSGVGKLTAASMKGNQGQQFQGMIGDLQNVLFDKGLDKKLEFEADLAAMETAYRTGYDPQGMVRVLEALQAKESSATDKKGSWFSTHPPVGERLTRLRALDAQYPDAASLSRLPERFAAQRARLL